ncbi:transcriptional regulator [Pectobacterium phage POP12]|nr:transcriptional regulator [Pectobacterium phage POP12]
MIYRVELKFSVVDFDNRLKPRQTNIGPYVRFSRKRTDVDYFSQHDIDLYPDLKVYDATTPAPSGDVGLCVAFEEKNGVELDCNFKEYNFGFSSIEKLKRWFIESDRESLNECGYAVFCYECNESSDVIEGDTQTIFKMNTVKLTQIIDIGSI